MFNILSYLGMSVQSEVCLWTMLGLLRTIFDATLFKVNANLKQVWQMSMPVELSMPVQRLLRTMISGVMLVQCFTVYIYLATYIVLLYPVFLEERPTLVLPWLLLAAIRKLLCELTSLALGLGTCVLLGPARPSCIKFVMVKIASITPSFYMWMLVLSYYHALKVALSFKTLHTAVLPSNDHDYGLELAVRRRCTKSLLGKEQLRKKLVANFYGERASIDSGKPKILRPTYEISSRMVHSTDTSAEESTSELKPYIDILPTISVTSNKFSYLTQSFEDWSGSEITIPRDADRILEQFVLMLLRIGANQKKEGSDSIDSQILNSPARITRTQRDNLHDPNMPEDTETPPQVGSQGNTAWYLREYPQIFMKRQSSEVSDRNVISTKTVESQIEKVDGNTIRSRKRVVSISSNETISLEVNKIVSKRKIVRNSLQESHNGKHDKIASSKQVNLKQNLGTKNLNIKTTHAFSKDERLQNNQESIKEESMSEEKLISNSTSTSSLTCEKKYLKDDKTKHKDGASSSRYQNHNHSKYKDRSLVKDKSSPSSETDDYKKSKNGQTK